LDARLEELGAKRFCPRGEGDDSADIEEDWEQWLSAEFWPSLERLQLQLPRQQIAPGAEDSSASVDSSSGAPPEQVVSPPPSSPEISKGPTDRKGVRVAWSQTGTPNALESMQVPQYRQARRCFFFFFFFLLLFSSPCVPWFLFLFVFLFCLVLHSAACSFFCDVPVKLSARLRLSFSALVSTSVRLLLY
jgi:hypothetical protein